MVTVFTGPTQPIHAERITGNKRAELSLAGHDNITRLCFFQNPKPDASQAALWADSFSSSHPERLRAVSHSQTTECRFETWVTRIGDKVLPLSLLTVSFQGNIPPSGTPLLTSDGKIIGLILQPASQNTAYAIPVQAVNRVLHDIPKHQKLVRGWIGISLSTGSQIPRITGILPDSPAAAAGLKENDILTRAGTFTTERYPDAVNALFYSVPGQTTTFHVLRDNKRIQYEVTPIAK